MAARLYLPSCGREGRLWEWVPGDPVRVGPSSIAFYHTDVLRLLRRHSHRVPERFPGRRRRERPISVPIAYCRQSCTLPTLTMFHVYWHTTALRIRHVWGDVDWIEYFSRVYLRKAPVASKRYGVGELTSARWHFGAASAVKHVRGHGATQPYGWMVNERGRAFKKTR